MSKRPVGVNIFQFWLWKDRNTGRDNTKPSDPAESGQVPEDLPKGSAIHCHHGPHGEGVLSHAEQKTWQAFPGRVF